MEVSLTGKLVENTFLVKAERKATSPHFTEFLEGLKVNTTQQASFLKSLCSTLLYDVQDLSDAQCVMCLPWLQVPGTLQLFWAQDKQHDYIDEWTSTRLSWQWDRTGFSSSGYIKQCLLQQQQYSTAVWIMAGVIKEMTWLVMNTVKIMIYTFCK